MCVEITIILAVIIRGGRKRIGINNNDTVPGERARAIIFGLKHKFNIPPLYYIINYTNNIITNRKEERAEKRNIVRIPPNTGVGQYATMVILPNRCRPRLNINISHHVFAMLRV